MATENTTTRGFGKIETPTLTADEYTAQRSAVYTSRFKAWRGGKTATMDTAIEAVKHNKTKPMAWLENDLMRVGRIATALNKKGVMVAVGYRTVLDKCKQAQEFGVPAPFADCHIETALFCQAVYQRVKELRADVQSSEIGEKAIERRRLLDSPEFKERQRIALSSEFTALDGIHLPIDYQVESVGLSEISEKPATVQVAPSIPVSDLLNSILEDACENMKHLKTKGDVVSAYRETLRRLAVIA